MVTLKSSHKRTLPPPHRRSPFNVGNLLQGPLLLKPVKLILNSPSYGVKGNLRLKKLGWALGGLRATWHERF